MATIASVSRLSDRVPDSVSSSGCVFAVVGLLTGKLSMNAIRRLLMSISSASRDQDFANARNSDRSSSASGAEGAQAMQCTDWRVLSGGAVLVLGCALESPKAKICPGEIFSISSLLSD